MDGAGTLLERIQARLAVIGKSAHKASLDSGLGADFIRNIERGSIKNPTAESLLKLADALETTIMYLLGMTNDPAPNLLAGGGARLPVRRGVQAGVWVDASAARPKDRASEIAPSALYAGAAQWAEPVLDDHLAGLGVKQGALLHCVDARAIQYQPKHGDVVIVRRVREGGLEERTGRLVRAASAGLELATQPGDSDREDALPMVRNGGAPSDVHVEALVIGALQPVGLIR